MKVEQAMAEDVPALAAIWHAGWHQGHAAGAPAALTALRTPTEFQDRVLRLWPQTWVMRTNTSEIAGFFMLKDAELYQFYLAAPYQGRGIAAALMAAAEDVLAPRRAWLACATDNIRAARFYEKCGWTRVATENYTTETAQGPMSLDVWRYEKDLSVASTQA